MPRRLNMICDPVIDRLVVLLGVDDILVDLGRVVRLRRTVPGTHVDTDSERVREELLRGPDVDVLAGGWGTGVEVRVVRGELTTEGVHATGNLTSLLIRPADGREVRLVVHEARVEERLDVRVRRRDVDLRTFHQSQSPLLSKLAHLSTGSRVLQVLEHRDVLAGRQERVVGVRARDDRAEHDGLVGLVLEVAVVKFVEFWAHLLQFLFGRADLIAFLSL